MTYLIINTTSGKYYYGNSIWTFDILKVVHFPSKQSAREVAKGLTNVKVVTLK